VQVVSILAVPIRFLQSLFQSKEVKGAENSFYFFIKHKNKFTFRRSDLYVYCLVSLLILKILRDSPLVAIMFSVLPCISGTHISLVGGYLC
jgi:hypothetical protein